MRILAFLSLKIHLNIQILNILLISQFKLYMALKIVLNFDFNS